MDRGGDGYGRAGMDRKRRLDGSSGGGAAAGGMTNKIGLRGV